MLSSADPYIAGKAIRPLQGRADVSLLPQLKRLLTNKRLFPSDRAAIIDLLVEIGTPDALNCVRRFRTDSEWFLRVRTARALSPIESARSLKTLLKDLESSNPSILIHFTMDALKDTLEQLRSETAVPALLKSLDRFHSYYTADADDYDYDDDYWERRWSETDLIDALWHAT
jgi:HEAT repeat protein